MILVKHFKEHISMFFVAHLLEKDAVQRLGLFIMLLPIAISFLTSMIKWSHKFKP